VKLPLDILEHRSIRSHMVTAGRRTL
jgi:hypothetical protein